MTEDATHRAILKYLRAVLPNPWIAFHCPNGGSRHPIEAARMKGLGVMSGVPDLVIVGKGGVSYWMEVKSKSGRLQPSQKVFLGKLEALEADFAVVRSIDDARVCLQAWGIPSKDATINDNEPDPWASIGDLAASIVNKIGKGA